jgi:hypothetical protein
MKRQQPAYDTPQSRRDSRAGVLGCAAFAEMSHVGVATLLGTHVTAKINPSWVSGGLPREGDQ